MGGGRPAHKMWFLNPKYTNLPSSLLHIGQSVDTPQNIGNIFGQSCVSEIKERQVAMSDTESLSEVFSHFAEEDVARIAIEGTEDFLISLAALKYMCSEDKSFTESEDNPILELTGHVINNAINHIANALRKDDAEVLAFIWRRITLMAQERSENNFDDYGWENPFYFDHEDDSEHNEQTESATEIAEQERPWKWPITQISPFSDGRGENNSRYRDRSALKLFGYTVGRVAGWPRSKRQEFLRDFMELKLPNRVTLEFGDEYGKPFSATRLRKVAYFIAFLCKSRTRNDSMDYDAAINDWEDDLSFLKKTYYEEMGIKFDRWPDSRS